MLRNKHSTLQCSREIMTVPLSKWIAAIDVVKSFNKYMPDTQEVSSLVPKIPPGCNCYFKKSTVHLKERMQLHPNSANAISKHGQRL